MQFVYNMSTIINVAPPEAKGSLELISSGVAKDSAGKLRPTLLVQDSGDRHVSLSDRELTLTSGSWRKVLSSQELRQLIGLGLVQAHKRRRFVLPVELPAGLTAMQASIDAGAPSTSSLSK